MNPFQRAGVKISNWWKGEPQDSGGAVSLNSPSFLEQVGLDGTRTKPTAEVTYFTCLKMLSETLAKMPIKYYRNRDCVRCGCGRRIFSDDSVLHLGRQSKQKRTGALL